MIRAVIFTRYGNMSERVSCFCAEDEQLRLDFKKKIIISQVPVVKQIFSSSVGSTAKLLSEGFFYNKHLSSGCNWWDFPRHAKRFLSLRLLN